MSTDAVLLGMQAPSGVPRSPLFETITDPILPPQQTREMLAHFFEAVYDLGQTSHLSRLLNVLLGESGVGQLRKRYTYSHLSQFILTAHYFEIDRFYASIFGLKRFIRERLDIDPYDTATDSEWEAIDAADASYRNRVEAFSRSIAWAGTPRGMVLAATALLGEECRVYESYEFLDETEVYAQTEEVTSLTWGDLEQFRYGDLDRRTYAAMEGDSVFKGRLPEGRGEFIIRPLRTVTAEEEYHLTKVLSRLKPAEALLTLDSRPAQMHTPVGVNRAVASSNYWHIQSRVQVNPAVAEHYDRVDPDNPHIALEQPRHAFSAYQGEEWDYNADVVAVTSYAEDEDGNVVQDVNYDRVITELGETADFTPELALEDPVEIQRARAVSDGVSAAAVVLPAEVFS